MVDRKKREPGRAETQRAGGVRAIGDVLPSLGGAIARQLHTAEFTVVRRWAEIAGPDYAAISMVEAIRFPPGKRSGGVLCLVADGAHAPIVQQGASDILGRANQMIGYPALTRVTIRRSEPVASDPRMAPPAPEPLPADIGERLEAITDPDLQSVLSRLAAGIVAIRASLEREADPTQTID